MAELRNETCPDAGHTAHSGNDHHAVDVVLFVSFSLLLGAFCRYLTHVLHLRIPYTVLLLVVGALWGLLDEEHGSHLGSAAAAVSSVEPHLFLAVFLPPLIFEGSFAMRWHVFKRLLGQMMVLACIGVVFCTFLTGLVIRTAIHPSFSWADSILLGAILSATDPVSVVALLKTLGASVKLRTLIEGESLLNDGTAIVLFSICINISRGANVGAGEMIAELFQLSLGGVALGAVWAAATIYAVGRVYNDSLTETTIIVASAFLLFFVAEDLCHVSGVLAVVSLGAGFVWIGNSQITPEVVESVHEFWHLLAYFAETVVFVLAGVIVTQRVGFAQFSAADYGRLLLLYILLFVIRGLMVALLSPLLVRTGFGFGFRRAIVLVHGGLRGAVALALALIVELDDDIPSETGSYVLFYCSGVAFLTLLVNATTAEWLLNSLGLTKTSAEQQQAFIDCVTQLNLETRQHVQQLCQQQRQVVPFCDWTNIDFLSQLPVPKLSTPAGAAPEATYHVDPATAPQAVQAHDAAVLPMPGINGDEAAAPAPRPWFRTKSKPVDDVRLEQARLRYLRGTLEVYNDMKLSGLLTADSFNALQGAVELAQERTYRPLSLWRDSLNSICHMPDWLEFANQRVRVWGLRNLTDWMVAAQLKRSIRVARGFVDANRALMALFVLTDEAVQQQLLHEVHGDVRLTKAFLSSAAQLHPVPVTEVFTAQTASLLLTDLRSRLHAAAGRGLLFGQEVSILDRVIDKKKKHVLRGKHPCHPPPPEAVMAHCPLLVGLDTEVEQALMTMAEPVRKEMGQAPVEVDRMCDPVLILSGTCDYQHPENILAFVEASSLFNVGSFFKRNLSGPVISATTDILTMRFPHAALHSLLLQHPALEARLVQEYCFEQVYLNRADALNVMTETDESLQGALSSRKVRKLVEQLEVVRLAVQDVVQISTFGLVVQGHLLPSGPNALAQSGFVGPGRYTAADAVLLAHI